MVIRNVGINEVREISRIHALSWKVAFKNNIPKEYLDNLQEDFWVEHFTNVINKNINTVKGIYDDNSILIGCISYGKSKDERFKEYGEIISLYLLPDYFGKGYGGELLNSCISDLKSKGYTKVILWVLKENKRARSFYEKYGFIESEYTYNFSILDKKLQNIGYILELANKETL